MRRPRLFGALTSAQSKLSQLAPAVLMRMLLASAQGADRDLSHDKRFRASLAEIVGTALANGAHGYRREVLGYVQPWASILSKVTASVTLWHGTADNWSPIAMADSLHRELPRAGPVVRWEGFSHYSALREALSRLDNDRRAPDAAGE